MTGDQSLGPGDGPHAFWGRYARRYAEMPIRNLPAYEATLARVRAYLQPEHDVLELGCGTGTTALRLARAVRRYTASDYAPEMISIARQKRDDAGLERLVFCNAGCGDSLLPKGPFDAVLAFNLLHLLPDRTAALAEVADMLPQGGLLISKTPCFSGAFRLLQPLAAVLWRLGKAPHLHFLSPRQLEQEITDAGFHIVETGDYPKRPPSHFIVARKRYP